MNRGGESARAHQRGTDHRTALRAPQGRSGQLGTGRIRQCARWDRGFPRRRCITL